MIDLGKANQIKGLVTMAIDLHVVNVLTIESPDLELGKGS